MEILGKVVQTSGDLAQVVIVRDTACGHSCTSCGACQNREMLIEAENPLRLQVGDMAYVEVSDKPPYAAAFVVYILPLLLILGLCILFGALLSPRAAWIGAAVGIPVWLAAMYAMNKKAARRRTDGVIVRRGA